MIKRKKLTFSDHCWIDRNDQREPIYQPLPQYPDSLKKRNVNGQVTVKFLVDSSEKPKISRS